MFCIACVVARRGGRWALNCESSGGVVRFSRARAEKKTVPEISRSCQLLRRARRSRCHRAPAIFDCLYTYMHVLLVDACAAHSRGWHVLPSWLVVVLCTFSCSDRNGTAGVVPAQEAGYANFLAINKTDLRFYDIASFEVRRTPRERRDLPRVVDCLGGFSFGLSPARRSYDVSVCHLSFLCPPLS